MININTFTIGGDNTSLFAINVGINTATINNVDISK